MDTDLRAFWALYDEKNFRTIDQHEDSELDVKLLDKGRFFIIKQKSSNGICP
jgi:hypothetical protein